MVEILESSAEETEAWVELSTAVVEDVCKRIGNREGKRGNNLRPEERLDSVEDKDGDKASFADENSSGDEEREEPECGDDDVEEDGAETGDEEEDGREELEGGDTVDK